MVLGKNSLRSRARSQLNCREGLSFLNSAIAPGILLKINHFKS